MMKGLGLWQKYSTYEEYRKKELLIDKEVPADRNIVEELELNEKEAGQFKKIFE